MKDKINKMVIEGILPAPFYNSKIIKGGQEKVDQTDTYSDKYKQLILPEPPYSPISKIRNE